MRDYTKIDAWRLADDLTVAELSKLVATATSLAVIGLTRWSSGQLSVVS